MFCVLSVFTKYQYEYGAYHNSLPLSLSLSLTSIKNSFSILAFINYSVCAN